MRSLVLSLAVIASSLAQSPKAGDWPTYNHDLASTRFSTLTQINGANVAQLKQAWSYKMRSEPGAPAAGTLNQVTPVVVDGVMYLPAGNKVLALDPETGKEVWRYQIQSGTASQRGLTYWPGDRNNPPRVFFTTGRKLVALNARTGKIDPGFAREGELPLEVPYAGVPAIYKNLILLGTNVYGPGEVNNHEHSDKWMGLSGSFRAFDARTGAKQWEYHGIPHKGEVGYDTWPEEAWKDRGGANVWSFSATVDTGRGIVYIPISSPAQNYYGGDRKGNNEPANSIVAVDAATGKYKWHFQTVHHEIWDYNLPPVPVLLDIVKDGKKIPALAQTGKMGWMWILDRVTGKPVFGMEERPVAQGSVPGEVYSRTQPFPLKPPAVARVSMTRDDIVTAEDTTPEHAKACRDQWDSKGYYNDGPYTPWPYQAAGTPARVPVIFPGYTGGTNWGGAAADPKLGYVFVNSQDSPAVGWLRDDPDFGKEGYLKYDTPSYGSFTAPAKDANGNSIGNLPCVKPPWGRLFAVNANTGDIAWQVPLGITEGLPAGKQNTGRTGAFAGPIVTAGGLVFIGATGDARFRAFDAKSGKELWAAKLEYPATAIPITYQGKSGKQYVAVVAAGPGRGNNQSLVAFALP